MKYISSFRVPEQQPPLGFECFTAKDDWEAIDYAMKKHGVNLLSIVEDKTGYLKDARSVWDNPVPTIKF